MAMNRWGDRVYVAWLEHELLWVRAALTLTSEARASAYHQIAALRCCAFETVQRKATEIRKQIIAETEAAYLLANPVKTFIRSRTARAVALPPSELNQGARVRAMRMGGRA